MKQLTRDPSAVSKAREAEKSSSGLTSVSLSLSTSTNSSTTSGGPVKKKPVFKSTLQAHNATSAKNQVPGSDSKEDAEDASWLEEWNADPTQMHANGWADQRHDPRFVRGHCPACHGKCLGHGKDFRPGESLDEYDARRQPMIDAFVQRVMERPGARDVTLKDFMGWDGETSLGVLQQQQQQDDGRPVKKVRI
jgi:hypothetical protein